jgi:hypothetical protein
MAKRKGSTVRFIVSDKKTPQVPIKAGMRLNVTSTMLVGPDLKRVKNIGARLCGGSGTCLALVELGSDVINPAPKARARGRGKR